MSSEYPISDIIDGFRLPTTQYGQFAVGHIVSWSDPAPGSENVLYMRHGPPLGKGQYGEIYLEQAPNPTARAPKTRAVKEVNKTFSELHKIDWKREIEALVILSQPQYKPFFVDFFGWYDDSDIVYLAMEYFDLKDLSEHLNDILDEEDIRTIARQITQGLNIMHEHGIVHRDLKPKNIFVAAKAPKWHVKIADFGVSKRPSEISGLWTTQGTPGYMAPEYSSYMRNSSECPDPTPAVDLWSLGCAVYEMFTKQCPFREENNAFKQYCRDRILPQSLLEQNLASYEARALIGALLDPRPDYRMTAQQALESTWLAEDLMTPDHKVLVPTAELTALTLSDRNFEPSTPDRPYEANSRNTTSSESIGSSVTLLDDEELRTPTVPKTESSDPMLTRAQSAPDPTSLLSPPALPSRRSSTPILVPSVPLQDPEETRIAHPEATEFNETMAVAVSADGASGKEPLATPPLPPRLPPRRKESSVALPEVEPSGPWLISSLAGQDLCMNFGPLHCVRMSDDTCDLCEAVRCLGIRRPQKAQNALHVCETCKERILCEFCARQAINMPGDSHEADHFLRMVLPSYSFSFEKFLHSGAIVPISNHRVPQNFGSSWLSSEHEFAAPVQLRSGKMRVRFLLDAPPGEHKVTVYLRVVVDSEKVSSGVIGSGKKALLSLPKAAYGTVIVGASTTSSDKRKKRLESSQYLSSGFVTKEIRKGIDPNFTMTTTIPTRVEPGESLEVQVRSSYDPGTFKAGSPFKWWLDAVNISQFGDKRQLANTGEIQKRQQMLEVQKKLERERKIDRYTKYATSGLQVATMTTGLSKQVKGFSAAGAQKRAFELQGLSHIVGMRAPSPNPSMANLHGHAYPQQYLPANNLYQNAWEADTHSLPPEYAASEVDHVGYPAGQMYEDTTAPLAIEQSAYVPDTALVAHSEANVEAFEYTVSETNGEGGQGGVATMTYARWDATGV